MPDEKRTLLSCASSNCKKGSSNGRNNNNMFCISCVAREWMGPFGGFFYFFLFSFWVGKAPFLTCLEEIIPRPDMELAHKSTKSLMQKNTRASIYDTRGCTTFLEGGGGGSYKAPSKFGNDRSQSTSLYGGQLFCNESLRSNKGLHSE